ncbi:gamma-parvin isoform X1 [Pelobates cultripes]|uniref:Gamma-parvin n=1 Tax=Pelobates cultripes TaxID=61616 RepID=A0AAD1W2Y8_PELCU|nr:gamma-parvin isoform X1 [Pelobates cultripes]
MDTLSDIPQTFEAGLPQGEIRKVLQPSAISDPNFQNLLKFLMDWINEELKHEHIVVKSLEDDLYDGLILHHLLQKIGGIKLDVEEITLSTFNQKRKLTVILDAISQHLELEPSQTKWDINLIYNKDLLATLHLLVALARHFKPDLQLPPNVCVEVIFVEPTKSGMKTEKAVEFLTLSSDGDSSLKSDAFDLLFEKTPDKVQEVKQAIVKFVNKPLANLGLTVTDLDSQFADGVILLLLIGQLEGYFLNLGSFFLTPSSKDDQIHNVSFAMDLLKDGEILQNPINPEDIVNRDIKTTLRVLYSLFLKHKHS